MTDQKGSANNDSGSATGDLPVTAGADAGNSAPAPRGGRKSAASGKASAKKATGSDDKSRKSSGGRAAAAKPAPAEASASPAETTETAAPAAGKRGSRAGAAKNAAKPTTKPSSGRKTGTAAKADPKPQEAAAPAAGRAEGASVPAGRAGKKGAASATGQGSRQSKSAGSAKKAASGGRSSTAKKGAETAPVAAPVVDTPVTPASDAPAADVSTAAPAGRAAAKPTSGRTRGSRGAGRKGAAPAVSEPVSSDSQAKGADAAQKATSSRTSAEAVVPVAPADFPASFGDASPEDFFAAMPGADGSEPAQGGALEEGAPGEKKRRGRSRRSRGRKKAALAAGAAETPDTDDSLAADAALGHDEALAEGIGRGEDLDDEDGEEREAPAGKGGRGGDKARAAEDDAAPAKPARRKMFVSVLPEEQVEVVITEEGQVQEYYVEMLHQAKTKGNIYKAVVHNVDPNLQAAFVSYGAVKNGFLQIDEIHPEYYVTAHDEGKGRKYPPIQKVIKPGQEVLVQVVKEPAGTKGAFLTTYLSMPGRFLVLTPGREQIGVSRKVESENERARLRELLEGLNPGPGLGVIVRTVSMGASKTSLQRDLQYLKRTWKDVRGRGTSEKAPCLIYQEEELTVRAVRDYLTEAVGEVWIDDEATAAAISELAESLFPRKQNLVRAHKEPSSTLFERFNLQRQLDQIHSREVSLPSGGRLVIDPTEALTAIDINSGRSGGKSNFEDMAYRTNMEAAKMIPLQLRLRDIGGQIVADFIEMRDKSHWREVEKTLRNGMKVDRARYDVGKIGPFGMLEIVRQRLGSSAISVSTEPCPCCNGTGVRRNMEWQSQHALRDIHRALRNAQAQNQSEVVYQAEQPLALHLLNNKRQRLVEMEQSFGIRIDIRIKLPEAL